MALTTAAKVRAWANADLTTSIDTELTRIIAAVGPWLERMAGRLLERPGTAFTETLNGDDACGRHCDVVFLSSARRPVVHSGADLVTVTESGVALTVAAGYSETADVIVENANVDIPCRLRRNLHVPWQYGVQNIVAVYKAGPSAVAPEIEQLANELTWGTYKQPDLMQRLSATRDRHSVTWSGELLSRDSWRFIQSLRQGAL